jgi:hypothetical protein
MVLWLARAAIGIRRKRPEQAPASVHHLRFTPRRLRGDQVASGVDAPAFANRGKVGV